MNVREAMIERHIAQPGVEMRRKDGREVYICPGDDIRPQGWVYARENGGAWDWLPSVAQAEKYLRGEDAEAYC